MFGSWARLELTEGSDNDWAIVTRDAHPHGPLAKGAVDRCEKHLNDPEAKPGSQDIFGCGFAAEELVKFTGLDADSSTNLTRRMLLLIESIGVEDGHRALRDVVLDAYLEKNGKGKQPPRFLLNDLIRYWRTMCVDFEGKHRHTSLPSKKWVIRNAKLRTARKMLFVSGLVPLLMCSAVDRDEIRPFLSAQFDAPATDRVAYAFEYAGAAESGGRTLDAYDRWLRLIGQEDVRSELENLDAATRDASPVFAEIREVGQQLDRGFQALLFETKLAETTRKFGVL